MNGENKVIKYAKFMIGCGSYEKMGSLGRLDRISEKFEWVTIPKCLQLTNLPPSNIKTRDSQLRQMSKGKLKKIIDKLNEISESGDFDFDFVNRTGELGSKLKAWQNCFE